MEERLDGLEEMGKALKEDIEAMSEETAVTDTDSIILNTLDESLKLLKPRKD